MKRIFGIVVSLSLLAAVCVAQERELFNASKLSEATFSSGDVQTDNNADNWYLDFEKSGVSKTAYQYSLVKGAGDRGIGIAIEIPDRYWKGKSVSAILRPNILASLTENESGNGKITNVGDIKSVTVKGYAIGYELSVRPVMVRSDGSRANMSRLDVDRVKGNFEVKWDNPGYIEDVNKRDIKVKPVYPNTSSDLFLEGIEIRGMPYYPTATSSGYLMVYLNTVTVVADKAYDELDESSEALWGFESSKIDKDKLRQEKALKQRELERARQEALKAKSTEENTSQ